MKVLTLMVVHGGNLPAQQVTIPTVLALPYSLGFLI